MTQDRPNGKLTPLGEILQPLANRPQSNSADPGSSSLSYTCERCQDAHFVHPRLPNGGPDYSRIIHCDCMLQIVEERRREYLLKLCELPEGTEELTFENFEIVDGTRPAFDAATDLAQGGMKALRWLTLVAPSDRGKTHLAVAICREWLVRGDPALYTYVPDMLRDLRRGFDSDDFDKRFARYCEVPLLVLDDLGAQYDTRWVQEMLDSIVDHRYVRHHPLVITTNLMAEQMPARIRSRVQRVPFGKVIPITSGEYHKRVVKP